MPNSAAGAYKGGIQVEIKRVLIITSLFLFLTSVSPTIAKSAEQSSGPVPQTPYEIQIYTFVAGSWAYVMGVALAEFINKDSKWLRATAIESKSPTVNLKLLKEKAEMRRNTLIHAPNGEVWGAERGQPPFEKSPYDGYRAAALIGTSFIGFLTLDPKIKTAKDLSGKRVSVGFRPGFGAVEFAQAILEQAGARNIKYSYLGFADGPRALRDGLVDAALSCAFPVNPQRTKYFPVPALLELIQVSNAHFVSIDQQAHVAAVKQCNDIPSSLFTIPAGALDAKQVNAWTSWGYYAQWGADKEMPDHVVNEICRVYWQNAHKFLEYNPLGNFITTETMAKVGTPAAKIHPGALKFYSDKNIKTGWLE